MELPVDNVCPNIKWICIIRCIPDGFEAYFGRGARIANGVKSRPDSSDEDPYCR
jgi:hypothetical protein